MNFNQVLEWIKSNLVIVIFVVIMIVAPIAMYIVAGGMNKRVKDEVSARAGSLTQLTGLTVDVDGQQIVPNEQFLQDFEKASGTLAEDAVAVQKKALEFNQKSRGVLMPDVFPEPPATLRETIPKRFHERLMTAYDQLLNEVRAGRPPELETLRAELESLRHRFISQDLKKDLNAPLEPDELERLRKMLSDARIDMYTQAAGRVGMYVSKADLYLPEWNQQRIPAPAEMFNWQWQYWAIEDVLKAVAAANKNSTSVAGAPVKRVLGVIVHGLPGAESSDDGSGSAPSRMSGGFGGDQGGAGAPAGDAGAAGSPGMPADPKAPIRRNFNESFSGLVTQPLFDVLTIDFAIVVETSRLPEVLDAISRYNFNTITGLTVENADAFAATEQGFFYGPEPVCTATIRMETIWLREWTKPFMPAATRSELGIAPDAPAAAPAP